MRGKVPLCLIRSLDLVSVRGISKKETFTLKSMEAISVNNFNQLINVNAIITGSLLVASAQAGAYTLGSDIDFKLLHGIGMNFFHQRSYAFCYCQFEFFRIQ